MKFSRHLLLFSLALIALMGVGRWALKSTDGFAMTKVTRNFSPYPTTLHPFTEQMETILSQPFYYHKRGAQCFVFLSEDKKYVLKLLNNRLLRHQSYPFSAKKKRHMLRRLKTTYASYESAATVLKEETGVVFANLKSREGASHSILIYDKLGIKHTITTHSSAFILQKKAALIYPTLKRVMRENKPELAEQIIASLVDLVSQCHAKGFINEDPSIRKNFGVDGTRCVVLDVGRFKSSPAHLIEPSLQAKHHFHGFRKWLAKNFPELIPYFDQRIAA